MFRSRLFTEGCPVGYCFSGFFFFTEDTIRQVVLIVYARETKQLDAVLVMTHFPDRHLFGFSLSIFLSVQTRCQLNEKFVRNLSMAVKNQ